MLQQVAFTTPFACKTRSDAIDDIVVGDIAGAIIGIWGGPLTALAGAATGSAGMAIGISINMVFRHPECYPMAQ